MAASGTQAGAQRALQFFLFQFLLPLILCPLYPLVLLAVLPLCMVYRLGNRLAAKIFRPDLDGPTNTVSQLFTSNDSRWSSDGFNVMNVSVVKGRLSVENIRKLVEAQVLPLKEYKALKAYPVRFGGYFYWKPDLDFNVKNHVRQDENREKGVGNVSISEEDLKRILGARLSGPWKINQSLWELVLFNDYFPSNEEGEKEEKSVLVLRIHHLMADFYSIVGLLRRLCTGDSTISVVSGYKGRTRTRAIAELIVGPYFLCRFGQALLRRSSPFYIPKDWRRDGCQYLTTWTEAISLKEVSEARKKFGVSFQAVINALVSGAIYKLFKELGHEPPKYLIVSQPRYLPGHPGGLTNHVAGGLVCIPVGERDPIRKVHCSQEEIIAATGAVSPELIFSGNGLFKWLPYLELLVKPPEDILEPPVDFSVTGCPGPRGPVFIDGKQVERFFLSVGTLTHLGEASVSLCTSLGKMSFTFVARKHFVPDSRVLDMFNGFLVEEMQELLKAKPLETSINTKG